VLGVFFVLPVAGMLRRGLLADGSFDPAASLEVLARPRVHRVLWFTVWSASVATACSVLLGLPAAHALHRLRVPRPAAGRRAAAGAVRAADRRGRGRVPAAARRGGPLGFLGLDGPPAAIVAGLVFFNVAVVIRAVGPPGSRSTRGRRGGRGARREPVQVLRTVTLPALRPAIVSAASVVFLFCATAFGVVLTLGGLRYATVETEIYLLTTNLLDLQAAAALSVLQLLA
jgi:thiamine transport system permease protein